MDDLIAFIEARLIDIELELRLNPDDGMFAAPLMTFVKGTRGIIFEYRDMFEACAPAIEAGKSDGKDWASGFLAGLEAALKHIAVDAWLHHPDFRGEWAQGLSWPKPPR